MLYWILILSLIVLLPLAWVALFRKGSVLHELVRIPILWWRMGRTPLPLLRQEKHLFGDHPRQYFVLYYGAESPNPPDKLLIYFHGGGWRHGSPEFFASHAGFFVRRGFAVAITSYRRPPRFAYQDIRNDLNRYLMDLRRVIQNKGWSIQKTLLGGMSAGGNLAALLFFNARALRRAGWRQQDFSGLFFLAAPLDLHQMPKSHILHSYAGRHGSNTFRRANPAQYLPANHLPPMFFIHGEKDGLVPQDCTVRFLEKLPENGCPIATCLIDGGTHLDAVEWVHADGPLRRQMEEWLGEVLGMLP